jgi:sterol 3beta-glucosyltransferase
MEAGPMKIVIMAAGGRGDVAPMTGLGVRLRAAGHHVALATEEPFAELVRGVGLEYRHLPGDTRAALTSRSGQEWQRRGTRLSPRAIRANLEVTREMLRQLGSGVVAAAEGADVLLLQRAASVYGYVTARAIGIPCMSLDLWPSIPTAEFAPLGTGRPSLGPWLNRHLTRLLAPVLSLSMNGPLRDLQRRLGVPVTSAAAVRFAMWDDVRHPILCGYSPAVAPRPADWRQGVDVVGYWWPARPMAWTPPAELTEFLAAGAPPVFVGFGSMGGGRGAQLGQTILSALRRARVRAVVQAGWAGLDAEGDDILAIGDVPHDWLFPHMAAVVHHGGAGTTGAGIRAGVPSVLTPVMADQPFWAQRVTELAISPGWVPFTDLTGERLGDLIVRAVADPVHRRHAEAIAARVRAEDGAGRVAEVLDRLEGHR